MPTDPPAFLLYLDAVVTGGPTLSEILFAVFPTSCVFLLKWNERLSGAVFVKPYWFSKAYC